jgi:pseudaminic acid cytidylyltransferase
MKCVAVIPARGGSKRIPRKNISLFNGKPMIAYAIGAAQASGLFDAVIVSTDDEEVAAVAQQWGAHVPFCRPAELADDHVPTVPVIQHAVNILRLSYSGLAEVCCIYPCVPLLQGDDLKAAHLMLTDSGADFVYPVGRFESSPFRAMHRDPDGRMRFLFPQYELTRTQDLKPCFHDAGQFYFGRADAWAKGLLMHSGGVGLELGAERFVDIDTPQDWCLAEQRVRELAKTATN